MERKISLLVVFSIAIVTAFSDRLQCKDPKGQPVDWFTAIKLPNLKSDESDGTVYFYMDAKNSQWTFLTGITTEESAIGYTVGQMYSPSQNYNNSIMWIVYNDEPTNGNVTYSLGHSKGVVVANNDLGFWLVHSVPKFPQLPYQNNSYRYPKTGVKYGQSFLCMSMMAEELDKIGDQLINNEVKVYGSHFGGNLKYMYPGLYNTTLPHSKPSKKNNGVRIQHLQSIEHFKFLSISKNRYFGKDLYADLITNMIQSNVYTETWLNTRDRFHSNCSSRYKTLNIKTLSFEDNKGFKTLRYNSSKDHSKWVISGKSSVPWTCIGDINRGLEQTHRGGGTVCIVSSTIWNQFKKLVFDIEKCTI